MAYKYFMLLSKLNGIALDVKGASKDEGSSIIMWENHQDDNQMSDWSDSSAWYEEPMTGTIRSKINDLCLDSSNDGKFSLINYQEGNRNQQWKLVEGVVRNRKNERLVLTVDGGCEDKETCAVAEKFTDVVYQKWDVVYNYEEANHAKPESFYIVSDLNDLVVGIKGEYDGEGTKILTYRKHEEAKTNQLWYVDHSGFIKSIMNNMVFSSDDPGDKLRTYHYKPTPRYQWRFQQNRLMNGVGECLDIRGADKDEGAKLCSYKYNGDKNQHWRLEYANFY